MLGAILLRGQHALPEVQLVRILLPNLLETLICIRFEPSYGKAGFSWS